MTTSLARLVARNMGWLAMAQVVGRASGFVVTIILARLLTPSDFGLAGLAAIAVGLIAVFGDVGLTSALIQRLEITEAHLSTTFWLNTGAATIVASLGIAATGAWASLSGKPTLAGLLAVLMLSLPLRSLGQVSDALLQRRIQFKRIGAADSLAALGSGIVAIALAASGAGVWALIWQAVILAALASALRVVFAGWLPRLTFRREAARELFSFSASLLGLYLLDFTARNADNLLVGVFLGVRALGYYTIAYNLVLLPSTSAGSLIQRVMVPILSSLQNELDRFRGVYLRMARLVATVNLPLVAGLAATAPLLVVVLYGAKWAPAAPLVRILAVVGAFEGLGTSSIVFFARARLTLLLGWATVTISLQTLAFAIGLSGGVTGVAWSYAAVSPIVFLLPHVLANRLISLPNRALLRAVFPALAASAVMGSAIAGATGWSPGHLGRPWAQLVALVCAGAVLYGALLLAAGLYCARSLDGTIAWLLGRQPESGEPAIARRRAPLAGLWRS